MILAQRNPRARIVACETSPQRHGAMKKRLAALASQVECRLTDAIELNEKEAFDRALVDAPCSGTGTLGRNPEIRHRLRPEEMARQAERQQAILASALRAVRLGGQTIYSTCSLEPEENEQVVEAVLAAAPSVRVVSLAGAIDGLEKSAVLTAEGASALRSCLTEEGFLRLLPGRLGTDGFFIAALERVG
jgi:16S rRNA (cytosine967-C5)-methyltransferase